WKGWAIFLRQKQKKLIMLPSEIMIWQPEFTDKILSRKPGAVQGGMLSMSFRHVLVAGTVAISTLARVHSNLLLLDVN
ncbi:hypothetical protein, partial [Escherichia coli]|uniref:hypothetical protein n=1 Tax=Escherichia coli TaxID=562 RepID=UPI001C91652A